MSNARLLYVSKLYDCEDPMNDLFNILTEALNFNSRNAILGLCIMGMVTLFNVWKEIGTRLKICSIKILKDPRHKNCEVLYFEDVNDRLFSDWHMKYANIHQDILGFFAEHNLDEFNPYTLNAETIPQFIQILASLNDHAYTLKAS